MAAVRDVDVAGSREAPGELPEEPLVLRVLRGQASEACLADAVPGGPREIAEYVGVLRDQVPYLLNGGGDGVRFDGKTLGDVPGRARTVPRRSCTRRRPGTRLSWVIRELMPIVLEGADNAGTTARTGLMPLVTGRVKPMDMTSSTSMTSMPSRSQA